MRRWTRFRPWLCLPLGLVLVLAAAWPAQAAALYHIDQRYGTIEFSVQVLGMFAVQGRFPRFGGDLLLDVEHPEQSRIDVAIDTGAVEMPLQDQAELLRSEAYFDTARHPTAHFASTTV